MWSVRQPVPRRFPERGGTLLVGWVGPFGWLELGVTWGEEPCQLGPLVAAAIRGPRCAGRSC
jgi:hypothetical protein